MRSFRLCVTALDELLELVPHRSNDLTGRNILRAGRPNAKRVVEDVVNTVLVGRVGDRESERQVFRGSRQVPEAQVHYVITRNLIERRIIENPRLHFSTMHVFDPANEIAAAADIECIGKRESR